MHVLVVFGNGGGLLFMSFYDYYVNRVVVYGFQCDLCDAGYVGTHADIYIMCCLWFSM